MSEKLRDPSVIWMLIEHKLHFLRHRQMHERSCTCQGTGRLPLRRHGTPA